MRIPYRPENFLRLLSLLPRSHLLFLLSLPCVPQALLTGEYIFLSPADRLSSASSPRLSRFAARPRPQAQSHAPRASLVEPVNDGAKNQLTGTGCPFVPADGGNHVASCGVSVSSRGAAVLPHLQVPRPSNLSPSSTKPEQLPPTNSLSPSSSPGPVVPSGGASVSNSVRTPSNLPVPPSTLPSSSRSSPPPSSHAAFLARCLEHFHRLRESEVHLLYRCIRRRISGCHPAPSQEAEERSSPVRCGEDGLHARQGTAEPLGLSASPSAVSPATPAVLTPSSSSPQSLSPPSGENVSPRSSVPVLPSSSSATLPCTSQSSACYCSAVTKSLEPSEAKEDSIVSLQAVGDFLILIWKSGRLEGLRKCFAGLKTWKRGPRGSVCMTGRATESPTGVARWHVQEVSHSMTLEYGLSRGPPFFLL